MAGIGGPEILLGSSPAYLQAYQQVNYPQMLRESLWIFVDLCGSLWIFVDIDGDICGQLEDTRGSLWIFVDLCGSLWIFVDLCGYSIQSYLHAGRPDTLISGIHSLFTYLGLMVYTVDT